jgi:hypothetical protein
MSRRLIAVVTGAMTFAGISAASSQAIIVEDAYAPPLYSVAPAAVYTAPVVVAPAPRVYTATVPIYAAPTIRARPFTHEVLVTEPEPAWGAAPGVIYSEW